jgi:adenine deaminase
VRISAEGIELVSLFDEVVDGTPVTPERNE